MSLGTDDYHAHVAIELINGLRYDQFGYAYENCTSYLAIQTRFDMGQTVPLLGTAYRWADNARAQSIPVDGSPRQYDFACFAPWQDGAGGQGHVALVTAVQASTVSLAEYNFRNPLAFGTREGVPTAGVRFIHYFAPPEPIPIPQEDDSDVIILFNAKAASGMSGLCLSENFMRWRHLEPADWTALQLLLTATATRVVEYELGTNQADVMAFGVPADAASAAVFGVAFP